MPNLSHNQEVLLTRQRHEADRAGLHYDVRMIVGDLAYSWATKKEMPKPGKAIVLWEQPVHDKAYALSKKVVIPKGQYGAGVTTLDWIRKGQINNPEEDEHKFTLSTKNGDRFLFKKLPDSYGEKGWLFKNLTVLEKKASIPLAITGYKKITQKTLLDKVEENLTKKASLVAGAVGTHIAQNIATRAAMGSKRVSKYLANSFSQGAHGVVDTSLKAKAKRFISGAIVPDVAVAHKKAHEAGTALKPLLDKASPRQKAGLRMLSQGRISDLKKYNLHRDEVVTKAHGLLSQAVKGVPSIDHLVDNAKKVHGIFKDKKHPLASNILANISKGSKPVGSNFKPGNMSAKSSITGSLSSSLVDPAGGALSSIKTLSSSNTFNNNRYGKKINKMMEKHFVSNPVRSGISNPKPGGMFANVKHKISGLFVNPVSAHLKRTSAALTNSVSS